jgi:hypothetical protein
LLQSAILIIRMTTAKRHVRQRRRQFATRLSRVVVPSVVILIIRMLTVAILMIRMTNDKGDGQMSREAVLWAAP